jgi:predicted RNA methylase
VEADVQAWHPDPADGFETVLCNPPFGAQKANRGGDRVFYDRGKEAVTAPVGLGGAPRSGGTVWFLAQPRTERFLAAYARGLGATIERVAQWDYPIEARFAFHDKPVQRFEVAGYRMAF